ncbi:hypothetical protein O0Q50_22345 [Priestia aryabhattai]|uniref:Uncharacterized protein n=1 Tax=Priestia aryabhattai TaxID=412384 RepID=A0AAX6NEK5_PRIAR|nr:hypothetical protein [Priestia aryabhattai]MDU9693924.1 hypothetical protein [Priestia aryabhattai]
MKFFIKLCIIGLYSIPFAYLSLQKDYVSDSKVYYIIMFFVIVSLSYFCGLIRGDLPLILGNILSFSISYFYNSLAMIDKKRAGFFTPVNSVEQLLLITVISLVLQLIFYNLARKFAKGYINSIKSNSTNKEKRV